MKIGLETEYIVKWIGEENESQNRPYNIFQAFSNEVQQYLKVANKNPIDSKEGFFIENGGAFNYEAYPDHYLDGLIESSTPESSTAREAICYQRAMEEILKDTFDSIEDDHQSFQNGRIRILKNCKDMVGHTYGSQENYEVNLNAEQHRNLKRINNLAIIPFAMLSVVSILISFLILLIIFPVFSLFAIAVYALGFIFPSKNLNPFKAFFSNINNENSIISFSSQIGFYLTFPIFGPISLLLTASYHKFVFKEIEDQVFSFLASRTIYTGAGSLNKDGSFDLSERSASITSVSRRSLKYSAKSVFDTGHLVKGIQSAAFEVLRFKFDSLNALNHRKQRIQISYSDSNRCHISEWLKCSITAMVIQMAERNLLKEVSQPKNPIDAIKIWSQPDHINSKALFNNGQAKSAIDIQLHYLKLIQKHLKTKNVIQTEDHEALEALKSILDHLQTGQDSNLFGMIDWITKKELIEMCNDLPFAEKKKIDLSYHDLREGPFELLDEEGLIHQIVDHDEVIHAMTEPPKTNSALLRSQVIKQMLTKSSKNYVSWHHAKIKDMNPKKKNKGKIIRLFD